MATRAESRGGGRRPGTTTTREAILTSARELFAARGYEGTTIRGIATDAGVDPALVHHFFGSKDDLFLAVLEVPEAVLAGIPPLISGDPGNAGEHLTRFYLGLYESPDTKAALLTALRSAVAQEQAARVLRDVITARLFAAVREVLPDRAELRMSLAMSHLTGLAIGRYVLGVPPVSELPIDDLVAWIGPVVQRYLTGPPPA